MSEVLPRGTASAEPPAGDGVVPPGRRAIDGSIYWTNADGGLIPDAAVKSIDKLQDELVRKIVGFALPLSAQVARFRQHSFNDVDGFVALLEQEYQARRGGSKGNLTFTSFDGLLKVVVQVSETIVFGPELQVAKGIVDECLREWSADSRMEIRAIINRAFAVDSQGRINRNDLFSLLRLDIEDPRWQKAMQAIRDSFRVVGSKRYIRLYQRDHAQAAWLPITIDVSAA
ncbi:sulfate transporter [Sphingobium indicum IP26]|uniref:Sulfate transporter n=1 Tax=Sphingobium indicum F2 TaxID=1450518 RepID=A0A8E1C2W9_9SPHN|nr:MULTISPECIES: DUF3164 family protein [Sphingobium]EPR09633.1 sulfate transporter [Sphingobium indicum IP26]EQB04852.1 sulfate transporter [Sphingobium sp. HDIP04]KER36680.1 sulfate transporter [Sphingobium indicum F2]